MADAAGVSVSSVQRIWRAHGLQPIACANSSCRRTPEFVDKLRDVVGLYFDPPAPAVVLIIDERSQIQALDRTQLGLPMKKGRAGTMTHDDRAVIGRNMQRHRHQEFIRFLNAVERAVPAGKTIHAILDNYAAHKHPAVRQWLARHPRWTFRLTLTSAFWLNAAEGFFATLTKRRLKRGVFRSVVDLQAAINRFLDDHNTHSKPFQWLADQTKSSPPSGAGTKC
jgi:transposase